MPRVRFEIIGRRCPRLRCERRAGLARSPASYDCREPRRYSRRSRRRRCGRSSRPLMGERHSSRAAVHRRLHAVLGESAGGRCGVMRSRVIHNLRRERLFIRGRAMRMSGALRRCSRSSVGNGRRSGSCRHSLMGARGYERWRSKASVAALTRLELPRGWRRRVRQACRRHRRTFTTPPSPGSKPIRAPSTTDIIKSEINKRGVPPIIIASHQATAQSWRTPTAWPRRSILSSPEPDASARANWATAHALIGSQTSSRNGSITSSVKYLACWAGRL